MTRPDPRADQGGEQGPCSATAYQRAEIQAAVNRERARCAGILERAIAELPADAADRELLEERLERIRWPWRVRMAARKAAVPGRLRRSCGICGDEDHTAPRHRAKGRAA